MLMLSLLVACAETSDDEDNATPNSGGDTSTGFDLPAQLERIDSRLVTMRADDDEFVKLSTTDIVDSDGVPIASNVEAEVYGETETSKSLLISKDNVAFDIFTTLTPNNGKYDIWVKNPREAGFYQVRFFLRKENVTGYIFINVEPGEIAEVGEITGERFEDQNLNGQRDDDEFLSLIADNSFGFFQLGPIKDAYGNLVEADFIDWGFIGGDIVTESPSSISSGFASVIIQTEEADLVGTLSAVAQKKTGFNDINLDGFQQANEESFFETLNLNTSETIVTVLPNLSLTCNNCPTSEEPDTYNFGKVFLNQTETRSFTLTNDGSTRVDNLFYSLTPPFDGVSGSNFQCGNLTFPEEYCVCRSDRFLVPGGSCLIDLDYTAFARTTTEGRLTITSSSAFEGANLAVELRAEGVKRPELQFSQGSIDFGTVAAGETKRIELYIQNLGDVSALNVSPTNPPPNTDQENGFYNIVFPAADDPIDPDPNVISNCGNDLPPNSKKCRVFVDFSPAIDIEDEILFGFVTSDNADSRLLIVRGSSFVNNYNPVLPVSFDKNEILADAIETARVTFGPLLDVFGQPVSNATLEITIDKGFIFGNTLFEDVSNGFYTVRTNSSGLASVEIKARERNEIGIINLNVVTRNELDNVLSSGAGSLQLNGVILTAGGLVEFGSGEIGDQIERQISLFNSGTKPAENISFLIEAPQFSLTDEGTCVGLNAGTLSLNASSSCEFTLRFSPDEEILFASRLNFSTTSFGISESTLLRGSGLVRAELSTITEFEHFDLAPGQAIQEEIILSNDGGENAENVTVTPSALGSSFLFSNNCVSIPPISTCSLEFTFSPTQVDKDITSIDLSIQGEGDLGLTDPISVPISFTYSRLRYDKTPNTINKGACSAAWSFKTVLNNEDINAVNNVIIDLDANVPGTFYSDSACTNPITKVQIPGGSNVSSDFYFIADTEGILSLEPRARLVLVDEIPGAYTLPIFGDPERIEYLIGDGQTTSINKTLPQKLKVRVVDNNGLALRNIPITFEILNGNGILSDTEVLSNGIGEAEVEYTTGTQSGINVIRASASTVGTPSEIRFEILVRERWLENPPKVSSGDSPVLWDYDAKGNNLITMQANEDDNANNRYKVTYSVDGGLSFLSFNNQFMEAGDGNVMLSDPTNWYIYSPKPLLLNNGKYFLAYLDFEDNQVKIKGAYGELNLAGTLQLGQTNASMGGIYQNTISPAGDSLQRFDLQVQEFNGAIFLSAINSSGNIEVYFSDDNGETFNQRKILKDFEGNFITVDKDMPYKLFVSGANTSGKSQKTCLIHTRVAPLEKRLMMNCTEDLNSAGVEEWALEQSFTNGSDKGILLGFDTNTIQNNAAIIYTNDNDQEARLLSFNIFDNVSSGKKYFLSPYKVSFNQGFGDESEKPLGFFYKQFLDKVEWYTEDGLIVSMDYKTSENLERRETYLHKIPDINIAHSTKIDIPVQNLDNKTGDESTLTKLSNDNILLTYKEFSANMEFSNAEGTVFGREFNPFQMEALSSVKGKHGSLYLTPTGAYLNDVLLENVVTENALSEDSLNNFVNTNFRFENGALILKSGLEYDFRNVTLLAGAQIIIEKGDNFAWTKFLVQGDFINYGTIRALSKVNDNNEELLVEETFDGKLLSHTYPAANFGGAGGAFLLPINCQELLDTNSFSPSDNGLYLVDPDGNSEVYEPREVYCEFEANGSAYTYFAEEAVPNVPPSIVQATFDAGTPNKTYAGLPVFNGEKVYQFVSNNREDNANQYRYRPVCPEGSRPEVLEVFSDEVHYRTGSGFNLKIFLNGNDNNVFYSSSALTCLNNKYKNTPWEDSGNIYIDPTGDYGGGSSCFLLGSSQERSNFLSGTLDTGYDDFDLRWRCR